MRNLLIFAADVATIMVGYSFYHVYRHGYQPPHYPTANEEDVAQTQESARQRVIATCKSITSPDPEFPESRKIRAH